MCGNGLGPNNEGPMTGRGMGNCENGEGRGNFGRRCRGKGKGRRCGNSRGLGFDRGLKKMDSVDEKRELEERKAFLSKEVQKIDEQLNNL